MVLVKAFPRDLYLNFLPLTPSGTRFAAFKSTYTSDKDYNDLHSKYPDCVFHRQGNSVFCIPISNPSQVLGDEQSIEISANTGLFHKLIRESLKRFFSSSNARFLKLSPLKFIDTSRDLVSTTTFSAKLSGFHIFPLYEIETKKLVLEDSAIHGIITDISNQYDISWTIKDLIEMGIDVSGIFVVEKLVDEQHGASVHYTEGLGEIKRIDGSNAILTDFRNKPTVDTSKCFPEANRKNLRIILNHLLGSDYDSCIDEIEKISFSIMGGEGKFNEIEKIKSKLIENGSFICSKDISCLFGKDFLAEHKPEVKIRTLTSPTYVFDPGREKTGQQHDEGLNEFGPFDSGSFHRKEPRILIVVPGEHKGEIETFMKTFFEGIPSSKRFVKGFVRKYYLHKIVKLDFSLVNGSTAEAYKDACLEALRKATQENTDYDLAFVIVREAFHSLYGNHNPYLVAKSLLMSHGIPVQEIEIETIRQNRSWEFIMNNMGIACYAKLGGIPYTIATARPISHELIIGLGSTKITKGRFDNNPRYVGITTVFSVEGNYLLHTISREAEYEKYFGELKRSLTEVIQQTGKRLAWQSGDTLRLIFHQAFKEYKNEEIRAIKELVSSLTDYNVEYAFVTVHPNHLFSVFDKKKSGFVAKFEQKKKYYGMTRGKFVPDRGFMIKISPYEALVTVLGPFQIKTPLSGSPKPLLVSIHRESNFKDIEYLTNQIYQFTFLSWRSFFPTNTPVTISYSNNIANLLALLREVDNWNPYILATKLRLSRWFL
jgi:hypothetical protein